MAVLVTGASGFLGSHVLERLAASGTLALGLGRDEARCAALEPAGHRIIRHDLTEPLDGTLDPRLSRVERIIHCAALSSPFGRRADFETANVTATRNLVDFARRQGVSRFVHISSPSVCFAFRDQLGLSEDAALPEPVNHYARTKREAEKIVLGQPAIHPVVLRPRGIYGAGDRALLPRLIKAARSRPLPLFREGRAAIDLTHVDDVVDAVMAALAAPREAACQIFNISGGEMLAAGLMEAVALRLPGRPEPPVTRYGLGLFAYAQSLDLSKAKRMLDWAPKISFEQGLDRTFADEAGS
jgi:nucleoside-diphosphate-sugar epimerase